MISLDKIKYKEEQEANELVFLSLVVWSATILFIEIINELNIFYVSKPIMRFISIIIVVLTISAYWIKETAKKKQIKNVKYYLLGIIALQQFFTLTTLSVHALLAAVFPIIISSYYNDKRTIILITIAGVIVIPLSVYFSIVLGTFPATYLQFILAAINESYVPAEALAACLSKGAWIKVPSLKIVFFYGLTNSMLVATFGAMAFNSYRNHENNHRKQIEEIKEIQDSVTMSMSEIVESRDATTGGHVKRTSDVMRIFSNELRKNDSVHTPTYWDNVVKAAPLHDLGKISVDDAILRKEGKLNDAEYRAIKNHPVVSEALIKQVFGSIDDKNYFEVARNIGRHHHEKWDGSGYPDQLSKTDIPYEARIMTYVDVLDALLSKRSYKDAYDYDVALKIMIEEKGKTFDPNLMDAFINVYPQIVNYYEEAKKGLESA